MLASLLFGAFYALSIRVGSLAIPPQLPEMIPYAATVVALVVYSVQRQRAARRIQSRNQDADTAARSR